MSAGLKGLHNGCSAQRRLRFVNAAVGEASRHWTAPCNPFDASMYFEEPAVVPRGGEGTAGVVVAECQRAKR